MGKVSKQEMAELLKQRPAVQNKILWDDDVKNNEQQISNETIVITESEKTGNKPAINRHETDYKLTINRLESGYKTDYKPTIKRQESDKQKQPVSPNWQESGYKPTSKPTSEVAINRLESGYKQTIEWTFSALVGLEQSITEFIYRACQIARSKITRPLTLECIADNLNKSKTSVKNTLQHIEKKGIIKRFKFKNGRGGWTQYELPDAIYNEILQLETDKKVTINWQETDYKPTSKPTSKLTIDLLSSSSSNNIKTTTTSELPDEWNFNITPYARFGFTTTQLKQLSSLGVISASDVEQSLIEFVFDLENNSLPTIKKTKIDFLMGLFRKGNKYSSEAYLNDDEAMILEMARRAEEKRKNLLNQKFEVWEGNLSDEERKEIESKLPTHLMVLHRTYGVSNEEVRKWMFDYFMQSIKCST